MSVAAALAQLALTLVCLIPYSTIWFPISFALAVFGCAPFFVTMSLRNRRWRNRQPFEWSFFEQMLWVQNASKDCPLAADARRTDALDLVERHLIERFARTPLDLPSQSARARRWQSASLAVIAQRPLLEDPATAVEDSQQWFERCIELVLPPRKKSRHRGASFGEGQLPKPLPKLKQDTALQAPWVIVVLYTNVLMLLSATFAEDIGAEVRDLIAAPITADITSTMNEVITSLTGLAALVAAVIPIVRGSRRSIVR
ncbi:hypothetical protein [Rathayibacter sp. VKM Ac-2754]|uniref:hypothetical protein n=1 Tax=Rathayibacter sp. VKM Ac-2754 TaxID=2609251 RepID=UPI00135B3539|nr:hypothetical protein [Rathayibacter sp. VKM Ac-2754]MWV59923.1 hypothetical protein [Rathayibacter sp. VKM Ac-2754]